MLYNENQTETKQVKKNKLVSALRKIGNCGSVMNDVIDELIVDLKKNHEKTDLFTIEARCYKKGFDLWYNFNIRKAEKNSLQVELKGLDENIYQILFN